MRFEASLAYIVRPRLTNEPLLPQITTESQASGAAMG